MQVIQSFICSMNEIDWNVISTQKLVTQLENVYFSGAYTFSDSSKIFEDLINRYRSFVSSYNGILLNLENYECIKQFDSMVMYQISKIKLRIQAQIQIVETNIQYLQELIK